jgi:hypothetical protein
VPSTGGLVIGGSLVEAQFAVELDGDAHRRQRVEQDLAVADLTGSADRRQRQVAADAEAAERGIDIEPLEFADALGQRPDADAAGAAFFTICLDHGIEQAALGRRVAPGQRRHFLVEVLVAQVDTEPGRIVAEELAHLFQFGDMFGAKHANRRAAGADFCDGPRH